MRPMVSDEGVTESTVMAGSGVTRTGQSELITVAQLAEHEAALGGLGFLFPRLKGKKS